jgi:hypothetical protein
MFVCRQELRGGGREPDQEDRLGVDLRQRFRLTRQARGRLVVEEFQRVLLRLELAGVIVMPRA